MRKFILILVALMIGASIGLASSELWLRVRTYPYCTVAQNAESFHTRFVRVKAKVHFGTYGMYVYEDCDPVEALAASVTLDGEQGFMGIGYVNELLLSGPPQLKTADAIIEGDFDAHASTGCWAPKFRITARKIELISAVEDVPPVSDSEGPALRTKH